MLWFGLHGVSFLETLGLTHESPFDTVQWQFVALDGTDQFRLKTFAPGAKSNRTLGVSDRLLPTLCRSWWETAHQGLP